MLAGTREPILRLLRQRSDAEVLAPHDDRVQHQEHLPEANKAHEEDDRLRLLLPVVIRARQRAQFPDPLLLQLQVPQDHSHRGVGGILGREFRA